MQVKTKAIVISSLNYDFTKWVGNKISFTINNLPLPSNYVTDIKINGRTREVFIATSKELVSFGGISTDANEDLSNVYVYPNLVRPTYTATVKVAGLIDKANVKITDIEGNLVYKVTSLGRTIEWDTTAFGRYKVASGVYMVFISVQDGVETKVKSDDYSMKYHFYLFFCPAKN
ncbi:hypothetical protein GCM10022422_43210 [Flavobacterium ginsengisoli]|uniref:Secretion system C-terminal sorting domain-containing protein n=1 Tax=Flavobacterium ginsengisoli TaxID=871694 RepID=A0ABP7G090_9FLAO